MFFSIGIKRSYKVTKLQFIFTLIKICFVNKLFQLIKIGVYIYNFICDMVHHYCILFIVVLIVF